MSRLLHITIYIVAALFMHTAPSYAHTNQADANGCHTKGNEIATKQSGRLVKAERITQDGKELCLVVVIIHNNEGERPRRLEVAVPAK